MGIPLGDLTGVVTRGNETVVIALVATPFTPAETGDVLEHLRVPGGELVGGADDIDGPLGPVDAWRQQWKVVGQEPDVGCRVDWLRGRLCSVVNRYA